jgi:hypothetical protein
MSKFQLSSPNTKLRMHQVKTLDTFLPQFPMRKVTAVQLCCGCGDVFYTLVG